MSTASVPGGTASGRKPLVVLLVVIGVLALILGVLYMVAGSSLPGFLTAGSHVKNGNHLERGGVCLVVGVVFLIGSFLFGRNKARA